MAKRFLILVTLGLLASACTSGASQWEGTYAAAVVPIKPTTEYIGW